MLTFVVISPHTFLFKLSCMTTPLSPIEPLHSLLKDVLYYLVITGIFLAAIRIPLIANSKSLELQILQLAPTSLFLRRRGSSLTHGAYHSKHTSYVGEAPLKKF